MIMPSPVAATPAPEAAASSASTMVMPAVTAPVPRQAFAPAPTPMPTPTSLAASVHAAVLASNVNPAATVIMRSITAEDIAKQAEAETETPEAASDDKA